MANLKDIKKLNPEEATAELAAELEKNWADIDPSTIKSLIEQGAAIETTAGYNGENALNYAAWTGNKEFVLFLIQNGADPNATNKDGKTPLHRARTADIAQVLITGGAKPNATDKDGDTPLHWAGTADIAQVLITGGAKPNATNKDGNTPLHEARTADIAQVLIDNDANPNATNKDGKTPLHRAKTADMAQILIDNGATPKATSKDGDTPLHWAQTADIAQILITGGADPNAKTKNGHTPLHWAQTAEIAQTLITGGANPNAKNKNDDTPLHQARTADIAQVLITGGANPNATNKDGQTPLMNHKDPEIRAILSKAMKKQAQEQAAKDQPHPPTNKDAPKESGVVKEVVQEQPVTEPLAEEVENNATGSLPDKKTRPIPAIPDKTPPVKRHFSGTTIREMLNQGIEDNVLKNPPQGVKAIEKTATKNQVHDTKDKSAKAGEQKKTDSPKQEKPNKNQTASVEKPPKKANPSHADSCIRTELKPTESFTQAAEKRGDRDNVRVIQATLLKIGALQNRDEPPAGREPDGLMGRKTSAMMEEALIVAQMDDNVPFDHIDRRYTKNTMKHLRKYMEGQGISDNDINNFEASVEALQGNKDKNGVSLFDQSYIRGQINIEDCKPKPANNITGQMPKMSNTGA